MNDHNQPDLSTAAAEVADGKIPEQLKDLGKTASDALCQVKDQAMDAGKCLVDTMRRNPLPTAAAAIGAGLLVWWLLSRRR